MPDYEGPLSLSAEDFPHMVAMINSIFRGEGGDMSADYARLLCMENADNLRVIRQSGRVVSHVGVAMRDVLLGGIPTTVAGVGSVATAEEARGQGFASILMRDAIERSRNAGADIMLISGDNGVYRGLHAVECGRYAEVVVPAGAAQSGYGLTVREAQEDDIDTIIDFRQQQSTRYLLPREDIEALWQSKWVMNLPSRWWMIEADGQACGYAITWKDGDTVHLLDCGAIHVALLALANTAFEQWGATSLRWVAPEEHLIPNVWRPHIQRWRGFEGTVLVLQAERFLQKAQSYLRERIGERMFAELAIEAEAQSVTFTLHGASRTFANGGELAGLFFGGKTAPALGGSPVDEALRRMFPVPLVWYGMGYV